MTIRGQYNYEGADEMILPLLPAFLCYCELMWQHFPSVLSKFQLGPNIPSLSCTPTRRSRTEILWAQGALPHVSPYTTQYLCIQISKINGPLSQNFSSNHRINTSTPAFWSRIKLTKNIIRLCLHRPQSEKTLF
jgi:hypothetical protein